MKEKARCFICETPYNIFNTMKLLYSDTERKKDVTLFLGENLRIFYDGLKETGLFSEIFIFNNDWKRKFSKTERFLRMVNKKKSIVDDVYGMYKPKQYAEIYIFSATFFPQNMIMYNKKADVIYVEDGVDSYIDRISVEFTWKQKMIWALCGRDYRRILPTVVYLNNPLICDKSVPYRIEEIPNKDFANKGLNILYKKVFSYEKKSFFEGKRMVYIGQAFVADDMGEGIEKIEDRIAEKLQMFSEQIVYRKHPREKNVSKKWKYIDNGTNMWELVCQEDLDDECILISAFSTALVTPKILYGKEPWLIYTYKLYEQYFSKENRLIEGLEKMIEMLRESYTCPEKIICVTDAEDVFEVVSKIINLK